ncbi:MAG TPA: ribonuclease III [Hyphomicrobiaceae bacterium]|nr:ribonuclease III [Hyphomicrobiaceae bacterium]
MTGARKYKDLEAALGYRFKSRELLSRALTHASIRASKTERMDNERLEFLGDRVLGLAIAELMIERHPQAPEGELARRFNKHVRREACAAVARKLDLGRLLILSDSEAGSGGRDKDTILADAMEALLAGLFLEAGFEGARAVIRELWAGIGEIGPSSAMTDPKSALQEWAQGRGLALPEYVELHRTGPDHQPRFTAEVRIAGVKPATGEGTSKRSAEQAAATHLLSREGVWSIETNG